MADIASMSIEELGRYVVTRPWWEWRSGMLVDLYGDGRHMSYVTDTEPDYSASPPGPAVPVAWEDDGRLRGPCAAPYYDKADAWDYADACPVLTDAATVGALLGIVEAMEGGPVTVAGLRAGGFIAWPGGTVDRPDGHGPTRAHALVALADALHGAEVRDA